MSFSKFMSRLTFLENFFSGIFSTLIWLDWLELGTWSYVCVGGKFQHENMGDFNIWGKNVRGGRFSHSTSTCSSAKPLEGAASDSSKGE